MQGVSFELENNGNDDDDTRSMKEAEKMSGVGHTTMSRAMANCRKKTSDEVRAVAFAFLKISLLTPNA